MISDKDFLDFINDGSFDESSQANLKNIIDEELEKPEEEMDTDLIEYCLDTLRKLETDEELPNEAEKETKPHSKKSKRKLGRILLAAALVAALIAGVMSATADVSNVKLFGGEIELYGNWVRVVYDVSDREKASSHELLDSKLGKEMLSYGFYNIFLPEEILSKEYTVEYQGENEASRNAKISVLYNGETMAIEIEQHTLDSVITSSSMYPKSSGDVYKIDVKGVPVYMFMHFGKYMIIYKDEATFYTIKTMFSEYEDVERFVKTIK